MLIRVVLKLALRWSRCLQRHRRIVGLYLSILVRIELQIQSASIFSLHPRYTGGPGESGVDFVLLAGTFIQTILGPEYDIVGFDPRLVL